ncbi:hypothetical protein FXB39_21385 [Nocardioides sp. BGMRC 2183]|nr:hypothetical protein FXB39_21385 [Nocardioides sp. BGMRC 2183]
MTSPQTGPDGQPTMRGDVTLVKSALLYADEIELLGLAASMVYATGMTPEAAEPPLSELIDLIGIVSKDTAITPDIRRTATLLEGMERRGDLLPIELRLQAETIRAFKDEAGALLGRASVDIARNTGMVDLQPAIDAGVVKVTDLGLTRADTIRAATGQSLGSDRQLRAWMDQIQQRLKDPRTHLLLDQETASFVDSMVREGQVELSSAGRLLMGKAAVGAGLVARLPAFPEARIDELLQLRDDLSEPLRQYRAAVVRISKTIPDMPVAELDGAVQSEWEGTVSPELDAISHGLLEHGLVKELSRQARLDTHKYLGLACTLFVGIDQLTDLSKVLAGVVSAIPSVGDTISRASLARGDAKSVIRRSDFYYLHAANIGLSR